MSDDMLLSGGQKTGDAFGGRRLRYDLLRITCALCVAFYHFECSAVQALPSVRFSGMSFDFLWSGLNIGTISVELFFLLSGLLSAKTLLQDDFMALTYYKKRLMRFYVPLWVSWVMICLWKTYWNGGMFYHVPAKAFPLTVLGLDGYLATRGPTPLGLENTFYLVGEWFMGALVIITLLWPLARLALKRFGVIALAAFGALQAFTCFFPENALGFALSYFPLSGLFSFVFGAWLGMNAHLIRGNIRVCIAGWGLMAIGLVLPKAGIMPQALSHLPYQLVAYGVFLLIDGFPTIERLKGVVLGLGKRFGASVVSLSGLTMYFFMFQHVMVSYFVTRANVTCLEAFDSFNYFGLVALAFVATLLIAMAGESIEKKLRRLLGA